eukprot:3686272-Prymnesium_polylepis.1
MHPPPGVTRGRAMVTHRLQHVLRSPWTDPTDWPVMIGRPAAGPEVARVMSRSVKTQPDESDPAVADVGTPHAPGEQHLELARVEGRLNGQEAEAHI